MEKHFSMTAGEGEYSYAKNSAKQKEGIDAAKPLLIRAIMENLEIKTKSPSSNSFHIADLGCSTGPNTFVAVKNIIDAVTKKYKIKCHTSLPEFYVHFNDHVLNDFNTLFKTLPQERQQYYVSAVPGSFHTRLFPSSSLHIVHSSFALQWLSKVPEELSDVNSYAFNKRRISYANAPNEVGEAYAAQYAKDMQSFLSARAQELVQDGLMILLIPGRMDGTLPSQAPNCAAFRRPLEDVLVDMVNEGIISDESLDGFNLPIYNPSSEELRSLVDINGRFSIERLDKFQSQSSHSYVSSGVCRSGLENILTKSFGNEVMEQLFDRYNSKVEELPPLTAHDVHEFGLFVVLKRNI